jgi:hypothetical protein
VCVIRSVGSVAKIILRRGGSRFALLLCSTLDEWNKLGRAPGHVCGLIESSHVEHNARGTKKTKGLKRIGERRDDHKH